MGSKRGNGSKASPPPDGDDPGAFDRFESLSRRLVSVPKKEIDKAKVRDQVKRSR